MRLVPRWALFSSGCAPLLLVGGWAIAARFEGSAYDPATQTISVLAAYGSPGFWVMTGALLALGACHILTAWGLRPAALAGRVALAGGGVAALVVALLPVPSSGGSLRHGSVVVVGFTLLAVWPVLAADRGAAAPWGLRPAPSIIVTALIGLGAAWFVFEMQRHGSAGVAERVLTSLQSLWPFVVVVSCIRRLEKDERVT
ncbi:DUF998 domain-containing protein [Streptomyces sp. HUCO-GS316]|uniref:DUF998 domain-containing protein n=1 Tax=Streptomyces sp. HUCO-GS316 TaxID=2692198 RepID=UPI00136CEA4D|nr:DUF998 domain-containing protein [Streptomyces sp. HUCO-GS316]MXM66843.1 DUF998 domain-containing protein [Streptomyces sp. HUCO-GS316]